MTDTISDERFCESIGFTSAEVQRLLDDAGLGSHAIEVRDWYDGYRFGSAKIYCPWAVLNYVNTLQDSPKAKPGLYCANSSGNSIVRRFLRRATRTAKGEVERLIEGGSVWKRVNEQLTYQDLDQSLDNLWSILYVTGYLTKKDENEAGETELVIPNREVWEIYVSQIRKWFEEDVVEKDAVRYQKRCRVVCEQVR